MQTGKVNLVMDGQHGSTGKGAIAGFLTKLHGIDVASTNNLPNAGHTVILDDGQKFVSKIIPAAAFLNVTGHKITSYIGPGAGFFIPQLLKEIQECRLTADQVRIHPRAMVVNDSHAQAERAGAISTKHIASTMQGSGAAMVEKVMRGANVKLAGDYDELRPFIVTDWLKELGSLPSSKWLHEGSQGFSLGINHGSHYPQCTSRDCTVAREMADMGFSPRTLGDVYLVLRPFPIRVGNVVEDGVVVGYSGDMYPDQREITWDYVKEFAGYPKSYELCELTTVTKRVRRVFTFSIDQVKKAVAVNGANRLALNFANYLDYSCFQTGGKLNDLSQLPTKVADFISMLEFETGVPVTLVGTGPATNHVWHRDC